MAVIHDLLTGEVKHYDVPYYATNTIKTSQKTQEQRMKEDFDKAFNQALLRNCIGTGKTTWELVRLAIQSYQGPVLYLVPQNSLLLHKNSISNIPMVLAGIGLSELESVYRPENIKIVTDKQILSRVVGRGPNEPALYDAIRAYLTSISRERVSWVVAHELTETLARR